MIDEVDYMRTQEQVEYGKWLLETIADHLRVEATEQAINRAVYKGTDCGAWVKFDENGIVAGTIVEGSDSEFSTRISLEDELNGGLIEDEVTLIIRFESALAACETFANEVWEEVENGDVEY